MSIKLKVIESIFVNQRLTLIILLYLIFAVAYSLVTPIGRGADEWAHYWYTQFIAQNGRLPLTAAEREAAGYKSDWPPLYHLAAATLTGWVETGGPPTFKYRAGNIRRQLIPTQGPEAILHTEDERLPWRQEILVWRLGRFLSIAFSTGTLLVTYLIALEVFNSVGERGSRGAGEPGSRGAGEPGSRGAEEQRSRGAEEQRSRGAEEQRSRGAGEIKPSQAQLLITNYQLPITLPVAVLAFNPRFLFTGMLFNYDSLTLLLSSLFLWLSIRVVKGYDSWWSFWGLGALAGLAVVTKYLAAPLVFVVILTAIFRKAGQENRGAEERRSGGAEEQASKGAKEQRSKGAEEQGSRGAGSKQNRKSKIENPKLVGESGSRGAVVTGGFAREQSLQEVLPGSSPDGGLRPVAGAQYAIRNTQYAIRRSLTQAFLAFLFITGWWFSYLIIVFNEIDAYGPVLGTLAPLIRGDGSDRTVEEIFAWLSGGQAPAPDYIDRQRYTAWQIVTELPTTFWGNAVTEPYPLTWFVGLMTMVTIIAVVGLGMAWRRLPSLKAKQIFLLLLVYCALPLPFMLIRLFGARDVLEALQGRHILFLAGPAVAILLVWGLGEAAAKIGYGLSRFRSNRPEAPQLQALPPNPRPPASDPLPPTPGALRTTHYALRTTFYVLRPTFYVLLALLLTGVLGQLIFMRQAYPPLLPVRTTPWTGPVSASPGITLEGGAQLLSHNIEKIDDVLKITFHWQGGPDPAPEDYKLEAALVDAQGQTRSSWMGYQTQARYPTRAWEPGDVIRDEGWLPLAGLPAGDYQVRWRLLDHSGEAPPWQTLAPYTLTEPIAAAASLRRDGRAMTSPPLFRERETVQLTTNDDRLPGAAARLTGPDGVARPPDSAGPTWANFIIAPNWPPGDYFIGETPVSELVLRAAGNGRNFETPAIPRPLAVNFGDKIKLLGYSLPSRRVESGDGLPVTLYWQGLAWMGQDFIIFTRLLDDRGEAWGGYDRLARENYSTLLWAPGQVITDGFAVPVAPDAPNGIYHLNVGWYRQAAGQAQSLPILDPATGAATDLTAVAIGPIKVGAAPAGVVVAQADPQHPLRVVLGDKIELLGVMMKQNGRPATETLTAALPLDLTLYWQALQPGDTDYTVFVHLRDGDGRIVAQKDSPPVSGAYPTGLWEAGEIIADKVSLPLEAVEPGRYDLVVGLYDPVTETRLPVPEAADDAAWVQSFEIDGE